MSCKYIWCSFSATEYKTKSLEMEKHKAQAHFV